MRGPSLSRRDVICLQCGPKTCCSYYTVTVTGLDAWRIARAMQLAPADFLAYRQAEAGDGRFRLEPGGASHELLLAKRVMPAPLPSPCVFLVRTRDDQARCGLGPLRPGQCRAYPVYAQGDLIDLVNDPAGCVRTWSYGEVDLEAERDLARGLEAEAEEHRRQVGEWNDRVEGGGRARSFEDFCAYLLNRCAEREASR